MTRQSDPIGQDFTEKAIALDLARDIALKTASPFPAIGKRAASLYDEDPPIWYEHRHRVTNQRPCNHEDRGIRTWKIALKPPRRRGSLSTVAFERQPDSRRGPSCYPNDIAKHKLAARKKTSLHTSSPVDQRLLRIACCRCASMPFSPAAMSG